MMRSSARVSLGAIEQVYGPNVDLYDDVLKVSHKASPESIQKAFFERRQELLYKISKGEGPRAEQKMDAVVMAFRILGDPTQRLDYDEARWERLQRKQRENMHSPSTISTAPTRTVTPEKKKKKKKKSKHGYDRMPSDEVGAVTPPSTSPRSKKNRSFRFSMRDQNEYSSDAARISDNATSEESFRSRSGTDVTNGSTTVGSTTVGGTTVTSTVNSSTVVSSSIISMETETIEEDTLGEETISTADSRVYKKRRSREEDESMMGAGRVVRKVKEEVRGAYDDTLSAFDQVFHAFTLQDKDIKAVVGRIDKAKRQFETGKLT